MNSSLFWLGLAEITALWDEARYTIHAARQYEQAAMVEAR